MNVRIPSSLRLAISLLFACCAVAVRAAQPAADRHPASGAVKVSVPDPLRLVAGHAHPLVVQFTVTPGLHVQANPASLPQLIPTEVQLTGAKGVQFGVPKYDEGSLYEQKGFPQPIRTYSTKFSVSIPVEVAANVGKGPREVAGTVRFQACNDTTCFSPRTETFLLPVTVEKAPKTRQRSSGK